MPRQNRVTPFGDIVAVPERGTLMGNRGILHDETGRIVRPWRERRWISCVLEFNGRHRMVMTPNRYTELFFLDEATALAAGHRPCAECRRERFRAFQTAWASAGEGDTTAEAIDRRLHAARVGPGREKVTFAAMLGDLPDGVMVTRPDDPARACLVWCGSLHVWTPGGYQGTRPRRPGQRVAVLTPGPMVATIRAGYVPGIHPSAVRVAGSAAGS